MKFFFTFLVVLFSLSSFSQYFEGRIVYKNVCLSDSPDFKKEYCDMYTDSIQNFYYKNGNYKYSTPNDSNWNMFKWDERKKYNKAKKSGKIFWRNEKLSKDTIVDFKVNKSVVTILGYECDELIIKKPGVIEKYYFSNKLALNPKFYNVPVKGNYYGTSSITKSITLKTIFILVNQGLTLESTALNIDKSPVDDKIFLIPEGVELVDTNE